MTGADFILMLREKADFGLCIDCYNNEKFGSVMTAADFILMLRKKAAFLAHLVESDAATTSHRSSLKALSEESPGLQLATRHCFILEVPPNDMKDSLATESADIDMGDSEAPKMEEQGPISNGSVELKPLNDGDNKKESPSNSEKNATPTETNNDHKIHKLKHVAGTIFSAAAVKANLLANEVIEKIGSANLYHWLSRSSCISWRLNWHSSLRLRVIMRLRVQTEKARQRLIHERAQIIEARFGLPAPPPARGNQMLLRFIFLANQKHIDVIVTLLYLQMDHIVTCIC